MEVSSGKLCSSHLCSSVPAPLGPMSWPELPPPWQSLFPTHFRPQIVPRAPSSPLAFSLLNRLHLCNSCPQQMTSVWCPPPNHICLLTLVVAITIVCHCNLFSSGKYCLSFPVKLTSSILVAFQVTFDLSELLELLKRA